MLTITIRRSKTDQFNEGDPKTPKSVPVLVCPVKAVTRLITMRDWPIESDDKVFGGWLRGRLCAVLRMDGADVGIPASRIGNRSLRSGGATAMWRAGYDIESIKRWGIWKSASFQGYFRGGRRALSSIGQCVMLTRGSTYQFAAHGGELYDQWITNEGRSGGGGGKRGRRHSAEYLCPNPRGRMRAISKALSRELRHVYHLSMQKDGFAPLGDVLGAADLCDLFASEDDIRKIARGDGGNVELRFEMGMMADQVTAAIRAAQGHGEASGVADDVLPVAGNLMTLVHGTTLTAAKSIVHSGISRSGRLHVHFYEIDLEGRPVSSTPMVRLTSEVLVVVSAEKCERYGMAFYRSPNGVILTPGLGGFVPNECILRVRNFPNYKVLWSAMSQRWGSISAPVLGSGFGESTDRERGNDNGASPSPRPSTAGSSTDATKRTNQNEDGSDTTGYQVETMEQRKRPMRALALGNVVISDGGNNSEPAEMVEADSNVATLVLRPNRATMRGMVESQSRNDTVDIVITRTVETEYTNHVDGEAGSDDGDMDVSGSRNYPATTTSSCISVEEAAIEHPNPNSGNGGANEWRLGQPYYRDHTARTRQESRVGNIPIKYLSKDNLQPSGCQTIP